MKQQGAIIVDPADLPNMDKVEQSRAEVLAYQLKAALNAYLSHFAPGRMEWDVGHHRVTGKPQIRKMPVQTGCDRKAEAKGPLTNRIP